MLAESNPQPVCLVKSPADNKAIKNFLGYEWSSAKGNEGIKYLNTSLADDDDFVSANKGINSINTTLFNPTDLSDPTKINSIIRANFAGKKPTENEFVSFAKLSDMLDFSRVSFDKAFKTTPEKKIEIVSKFPLVKLGELAEIIAGQSPEGKFYNENRNGLPFYQGKTEFSEKYILEPKVWTTKITKEAEKNDILMSVRAPVGPVNFATEKCCIGRGLAAIRANEKINQMYLFFILKQNEENIKGSGGAIFDSISKTGIENIKIPLPPLDIQKQIVAECEKIDKASNEAQTKIEQLKNNITQTMQNVKGEKKRIWELCAVGSGGTPSRKEVKYWNNGTIPWLRSEVCKEKSVYEADEYITELGLQKSNAKILANQSTLVALVGATKGKTAFLEFEATTNQNVAGLKTLDEKILLDKYTFFILRSMYDELIKNLSQYDMLNLGQIRDIKIPVPSLSEAAAYCFRKLRNRGAISEAQKIIDIPQKKSKRYWINI